MADHWYITHWEQARTQNGERITVWTNVPCHLWMRWTLIEPRIHKIPVTVRGLTTMSDFYYCFDVYHDNEEEGPLDSIVHTFLKEPWPYCQERWFYFHGNINGIPSPSTSPVFYKHPIAPPEPAYADACYQRNAQYGHWLYFWPKREVSISFKPTRTYDADKIIVYLCTEPPFENIGAARFSIYHAGGDGKPSGDPIASGAVAIDPPLEPDYAKYAVDIPLTTLTLGQYYALGVRGEPTSNLGYPYYCGWKKAFDNSCHLAPYSYYRYWSALSGWGGWASLPDDFCMYEIPERL